MEKKSYIKKIIEEIKKYKSYIIISLLVIFLIYVGYVYYHKYFNALKSPENIKKMIIGYGKYGVLVFIGLQILQVVAFFIPGEIIQVAGGYIYGTLMGSLISLLGITIGSIIIYGICNKYGKPFVQKIISDKDIKFFDNIKNKGNIKYIIFILYLIPGLPKDALAYICGVSDIKGKDFLLYSTLGRIPGIIISAYFGYNITVKNHIGLIVIAISMSVLFIAGVLKGEAIISKFTNKN